MMTFLAPLWKRVLMPFRHHHEMVYMGTEMVGIDPPEKAEVVVLPGGHRALFQCATYTSEYQCLTCPHSKTVEKRGFA